MQTTLAMLCVIASALYVGRAGVRTVRSALGGGCASGCGKCAAPPVVTPESARRISLL